MPQQDESFEEPNSFIFPTKECFFSAKMMKFILPLAEQFYSLDFLEPYRRSVTSV